MQYSEVESHLWKHSRRVQGLKQILEELPVLPTWPTSKNQSKGYPALCLINIPGRRSHTLFLCCRGPRGIGQVCPHVRFRQCCLTVTVNLPGLFEMFCSRLRSYASGGNFSLCVCSLTSRFADSHQLFVWMRQKKPVHARNSREERNTRRHVGVREESRVRRKNVRCLFKVFLFFFFWHVTLVEKHTNQTCIIYIYKKNIQKQVLRHLVSAQHDNNNTVAETDNNIQFAFEILWVKVTRSTAGSCCAWTVCHQYK